MQTLVLKIISTQTVISIYQNVLGADNGQQPAPCRPVQRRQKQGPFVLTTTTIQYGLRTMMHVRRNRNDAWMGLREEVGYIELFLI